MHVSAKLPHLRCQPAPRPEHRGAAERKELKPYYEHAGITIYHGDCREILPCLRADLLFTDPPFGLGYEDHGMSNGGKGGVGGKSSNAYLIKGNEDLSVGIFACEWAEQHAIPAVVFASPYAPFPGKWG